MNALKTKAHNLIDTLPDDKMEKVLIILEGIKGIIIENIPDNWDLQLINEALNVEENGEFILLDDVARGLGFDINKLQDNN